MKVIKVFKAHWDHEGECFPTVSKQTVGGEYLPHLFTTQEKAKKAADKGWRNDRGGGTPASNPTSAALALQLTDGRVFPVESRGRALSVSARKKSTKSDTRMVETGGSTTLVSIHVQHERVTMWDGKGNPPKHNFERPTLVKVGGILYELETDKPVPLDQK